MRRLDFCTGLVTTAVGLLALWDASDLPMFGQNHVPGPGFFPKVLAILLTVLGVLLAVTALRGQPAEIVEDSEGAAAPNRAGRVRAVAVLIALAIFGPLVSVIGYVPAMVLLVLVVLYGIEGRRDLRSAVAALAIPVATFLLFAHVFAIPLPAGPLFPA